MLQVHHSNRTEVLLRRYLAVTAQPLRGSLTPEVCVVQSPGMGRWLNQRIADLRGIAANTEFPLPASFVWDIYRRVVRDVPEQSRFQRESLVWQLMARLDEHLADPLFQALDGYLAHGPRDLKKFQLCQRIADAFDQYLVYRPDMVLAWEAGEGGHWQASLWRALVAGVEESHRARLWRDLRVAAEAGLDPRSLPERVSLFGITALAPAYLDVVAAVATAIEVHVFVLNPCMEYWGDIEDERGLARRRRHWRRRSENDAADYFEIGNPLLASLGKVGRDFQDQILDVLSEPMDAFEEPVADHLLGRIQADILVLGDRSRGRSVPLAPGPRDRSIQVHSCHGHLREVQVLHDRILEMMEGMPGLAPREIVVMAPDIDEYAPLIESVFGSIQGDRRLPFTIADRSAQSQDPLVDRTLGFLDLGQSRLGLSEVMDWLHTPAVMRRFDLDDQTVERIRIWASEAGVRWGADAAMRGDFGLPMDNANTWSFGLDRLFAGYSLPAEEKIFDGILPYSDIDGSEVAILGSFRAFLDLLAHWRGRLSEKCSVSDWQTRVNELLEDCFQPDEAELDALQAIRDAMQEMAYEARNAECEEEFGVALVKAHLESTLGKPSGAGRFLAGGITFCNLVPMRSIPFRVVCLLGMNDQTFPRVQRPLGFDLMASNPRRGDRSRRADDRYLFLESLLSARDVFYLSYIGRDQRDNSLRVPSVVVTELLDYVEGGYLTAESGKAAPSTDGRRPEEVPGPSSDRRPGLVTEHPLQPFSRRCFDPSNSETWSYAAEWYPETPSTGATVIADQPLAEVEAEDPSVPLDRLLRFFDNPSRFFLRERLAIDLWEEGRLPDDAEPFRIDALGAYALRQEALDQCLAGVGSEEHRQIARARGELPHGNVGDVRYEEVVWQHVEQFVELLRPLQTKAPVSLEIAANTAAFQISGTLTGLGATGMVLFRLAKLRAKDRLAAWIRHLILNTVAPEGIGSTTWFLASDRRLTFLPLDDAIPRLGLLLSLYRQGCGQPLRFFPESSYEYARAVHSGSSAGDARKAASRRWVARAGVPGEGDDPAVRFAFRDVDPFSDPFGAVATDVFEPLFGGVEETRIARS